MRGVRLRLKRTLILLICLGAVSCSALPTQSTPVPTLTLQPSITTLECDPILDVYSFGCTRTVGGVILQSEDASQQTFEVGDISITFNGTIYVTHLINTLTIGTLEGNSAVNARNATRVLPSGMETTLNLQPASFEASTPPADAQPFTQQTLRGLPLFRLSRPISPNLILTPHETTYTQIVTDCPTPEGWTGFYEVQRGDSFSSIAAQFETTISELQQANCLANTNRLFPDDILRVPGNDEDTETNFEAEANTLQVGECTILSWSAESASLVYFQGEAVANSDSREVCPEATSTYTLLIVYASGEQTGYTQTVSINE